MAGRWTPRCRRQIENHQAVTPEGTQRKDMRRIEGAVAERADMPERTAELGILAVKHRDLALWGDGMKIPPAAAIAGHRKGGIIDPFRLQHALSDGSGEGRSAPVSKSVTRSSVPSYGICGCSRPIQARRLPSREKRGKARKCDPEASERMPASSSAPVPSSSTATVSRVTAPAPSECASRTAMT